MKAYLDNVICSGLTRGDLEPVAEMHAARELVAACERGELRLVTSVESWREQDRTRDTQLRDVLREGRDAVPRVPRDHVVLGLAQSTDLLGGRISYPLVTDVVDGPLLERLRAVGMGESDAKHIMYAVHDGCSRFVTLDEYDILPKASEVEAICLGLKIVRPTELVVELRTEVGRGRPWTGARTELT
jgi:hypothetical protein